MASSSGRPLRWVALVLAILVVGYAGVRFGRALRARSSPAHTHPETSPFPFAVGDPFPAVALADSLGGAVPSDSLLAGRGAVVLFLDPDCDGCTDMSIKWEHTLAEGFFDRSRVFAVSRAAPAVNAAYRAENRLSFPIYQDVADAFLREFDVTSYPLEVVVGQSKIIRSLSDDSVTPVDIEEIRLLMTE